MRSRDELKDRAIKGAKNIEAKINYHLQGHTFWFREGEVQCLGCGLGSRANWKGDYTYQETAQRLVKEHGDCGKPFDLKKRIAEIEAQYAPKTGDSGKEVTLATINADLAAITTKLDKIIKRLGIW